MSSWFRFSLPAYEYRRRPGDLAFAAALAAGRLLNHADIIVRRFFHGPGADAGFRRVPVADLAGGCHGRVGELLVVAVVKLDDAGVGRGGGCCAGEDDAVVL